MKTRALMLPACAAASIASCAIDDPCDTDDTYLSSGVCIDTRFLDGGADVLADGGADAGADGGACVPFGQPCTQTEDCNCDTNACALQQEDMAGICTHTGCVEHPEICPEGWQCVDFMAELPSVCLPPS